MVKFIIIFFIFIFTSDTSFYEKSEGYSIQRSYYTNGKITDVIANKDTTLFRIHFDDITLNIPVSTESLFQDENLFQEHGLKDFIDIVKNQLDNEKGKSIVE